MLDDYPELRSIYDENDDNTKVFYFQNAEPVFSSFTSPSIKIIFLTIFK